MGTTYYLVAPRLKLAFTLPNLGAADLERELTDLEALANEGESPIDTSAVTVRGLTLSDLGRLVATYDRAARVGMDLPIVAFVRRMRAYDRGAFVASEHDPRMDDAKAYRVIDLDPSAD